MIKKIKLFSLLLFFIFLSFLFSHESGAEFYRYVDKQGRLRFVDDLGKIPPEYIEQLKVYKEKYDHLPEKEKAIMLEKENAERKKTEELRAKKRLEIEELRAKKRLEKFQTKVVIKGGNKVMVPVTIGYKNRRYKAQLVFDTGAGGTVLHRKFANKLKLQEFKWGKSEVAGGGLINTKRAKVNYIKVGPVKKENLTVSIIDYTGRQESGYDGLLGMDFLRGLEYKIDFEKQVIIWEKY